MDDAPRSFANTIWHTIWHTALILFPELDARERLSPELEQFVRTRYKVGTRARDELLREGLT